MLRARATTAVVRWLAGLVVAGGIGATSPAAQATEIYAGESAAQRAHGVLSNAFPFRPSPVKASAAKASSPILAAEPRDDDIVEMEEMTISEAQTARHMNTAIDRDLARVRAEEFNWRTGGRYFRADFGRARIEGGLWWSLLPANSSSSATAANLPMLGRVDLLRISW